MTREALKNLDTSHRLCALYGFDDEQRQRRLDQLQLQAGDARCLCDIQMQVIRPNQEQIMDEFYKFILQHDELRGYLQNPHQIERLKKTQTEYLLSLGCDFLTADYFEYRLRVGIAHARIEMPLGIYLVAYGQLQESLFTLMEQQNLTGKYYRALSKILMLDMSLATDAYNLSQFRSMSESIDQLKVEQTRLTNQLMHDTLTGAYTRAYIMEQLDKRLAELKRDAHKSLAVALIDLDKFKKINDTYGHQVGDQVLTEFSESVMHMIRRQDYFGRYGGEEFLLVMVELDQHGALELAERLRIHLGNKTYHIDGNSLHVTASIGLSVAHAGDSASDIIARADKALYEAKKTGRNKTIIL